MSKSNEHEMEKKKKKKITNYYYYYVVQVESRFERDSNSNYDIYMVTIDLHKK